MSHLLMTLAGLVVALPQPTPAAGPTLPESLDLEAIRALPVQHDGRWPPLDTVARDTVESVTGEQFYRGHDPVLLLLAWTFDSPAWRHEPLFDISNAELRANLQLPATQTVYSFEELRAHRPLHDLVDQVMNIDEDRKLDPLESKVSDINEKMVLFQQALMGQVIRAIPDAEEVGGAWQPIHLHEGHAEHDDSDDAVTVAWGAVAKAFRADDAPAFATATGQLVAALQTLPAAHRPSSKLIATELRYNRISPFRTAWIVMVVGAVFAAAAMFIRRKWFDFFAVLALIGGFVLLSYGLSLRWQIAGRIPAANMFESLLFLSWGMGAFAIVAMIVQRQRIVPLTASAMGALSLFLADVLPLDHFVRPIAPVLMDTVWMSIHVPIIMVSYSVLALAVLIAHVQLIVMAASPDRRELANTIDSLHYWYVHVGSILLVAGIITGSMWAASSWGRYWGWDPKEVWSLVAFLGYMAILHVRVEHERVAGWMYVVAAVLGIGLFVWVAPKLAPLTPVKLLALAATAVAMAIFVLARGQFATALKSILAFWMIIMTYVGVNFVLGIGLHSYGFGTGAVVRYMFGIGGADLLLIAVCCVIYLLRRPPAATVRGDLPATSPAPHPG